MDLQMPVKDGFQCSTELRQLGLKIPIIALSADVFGGIQKKVIKYGMNDYIAKPVDVEKLIKKLKKWLHPKYENFYKHKKSTSSNEDSQSILELEKKLKKFDVRIAVKRIGSIESYITLLRKFHSNSNTLIDDIKELIHSENYDELKMTIHTLKGVTGNIGIKEIFNLCTTIEGKLNDSAKNLDENQTSMFLSKLYTTLKLIENYLKEIDDIEQIDLKPNEYSDELKKMLVKLKSYLEDEDLEAVTYFKKIKKKYPVSEFNKLEESLQNYDFSESLELLKLLLQT
jgi:HPt (histidine-containing phosphotransfer) domain-containing protein